MNFDCIIINPPYKRNMHLKILAEAIKHLKDDNSVCVNLSPYFMNKNELHILKNIKKFLYERQLSQIVISPEEMDSLFNIYGSCSGAITLFSKFKVEGMIYPEIEGNLAIVEKLRDKKKAKSIRTMIWKTSGSFSVPVQGDYGYAKRWHYTLDQMLSGNPNAKIRFNTQNEADNFVKTTTTQNIYKFIWYVDEKSAIPAHLPFLGDAINPRTGLKGYQGEWTDEDLYKYFNITPEEQKVIEETMKTYETK